MRYLIIFLSLLFVGCAGSKLANRFASKQIQIDYDKFKDITTYKTHPPIEVDTGFLTDVQITASFTCSGQQMCHPNKIYLSLYSSSQNGYQYTYNSELIFIADGTRIDLGSLLSTSARDRVLTTFVYEVMGTYISIDQLDRLANATNIEGRLGKNEFKISHEDRLVLRMLIQKINMSNQSLN